MQPHEANHEDCSFLGISWFSSVQSLVHVQFCDPVGCSMPCLPVHHQLWELIQTHVHRVGHAIQPSHPLSSPYPPAFSLSQHQGLFQWVSSSHQVDKVLEFLVLDILVLKNDAFDLRFKCNWGFCFIWWRAHCLAFMRSPVNSSSWYSSFS